jgi:hypothetical protein
MKNQKIGEKECLRCRIGGKSLPKDLRKVVKLFGDGLEKSLVILIAEQPMEW